ncbi:sodium:solute symporter family protein [Sedimentisphaera salicampi]|uniref:Na(+)/glucose symporter n=1 Tax=Sedimentisphaera salicampi TaxID=1941349 RepID=A0A1W6LLS1_9BACT|nr:hypothetical protein [Sedimentisphaera salicampi]ARN56693.1 Na(+)/glucose symporter [Sedimentisphaera salicampi]
MHLIDWMIIIVSVLTVLLIAGTTRKYMQGVADFLAAGRVGGRYMLCIAEGIAWLGAVSIIAGFETGYKAGFTSLWWQQIHVPILLLISLSGWIIYRYRETRALTLAQFFEMRYSRRFRIFAGILQWVAGIINMGIFPAVTARFFVYFCNLPLELTLGSVTFPTYWLVMFFLLISALTLLLFSGQIGVLVTDFVQGSFTNIGFVCLTIFFFFFMFGDWSFIVDTLIDDNPEMINPMLTNKVEDFNIWFYLIAGFSLVYNHMAWQGSQGYNASAKSPHEARMARIIANWRGVPNMVFFAVLPICAFVYMNNPEFSQGAEVIQQSVSENVDNEALTNQVKVTLAISRMLPTGLMGMFAATMMLASISTLNTYMHSWGSIFVQDVLIPIRNKPFNAKKHIWALRGSILFVALFVFCFGMLYKQTEDILLFFGLTGAIVLGGAGSVIIGGLYWRKGTTPAAYSAMIVGAVLSLGKIILDQEALFTKLRDYMISKMPATVSSINSYVSNHFPDIIEKHGMFESWLRIPINGQWMFAVAMASAILTYIMVSLLTCKGNFNLEKMLHRGKYKIESDQSTREKPQRGLKIFGVTEEFSKTDKFIYFITIFWSMGWMAVFLVGTAYALISGNTTTMGWAKFWQLQFWILIAVSVIVSIWLLIGGIKNMIEMFSDLKTLKRNDLDDGRVINSHNLSDEAKPTSNDGSQGQ